MVCYNEEEGVVISEQLSLVVGKQFLITFQEQPGTVFDPVRERVRSPKRRIRGVGSDFLAYSLLDTVVDNYLHIIERIGEQIEELEEEVMGVNDKSIIEKINLYRSEMNYLRKAVRPAREMIIHLKRMENDIIQESTLPFLNALLDLLTEASEAVEVYREMLSDTMTLYNTRVNLRMNDIMKVLTIFAAIFIPLTFIAGIYGTNFAYVPEYHYKYSYFIFWAAIVSIALSMVAYFKHKNWF
jgi:magnesium transporter